jgi:hypothetical protein
MFDKTAEAIVTAYHADRISYVEALRRLLDFGVPLDAATQRLAATPPSTPPATGAPAHEPDDHG